MGPWRTMLTALLMPICSTALTAGAEPVTFDAKRAARAEFNYRMYCAGCHSLNGEGAGDVPAIKDYIGHFFRVSGGRDFLVQVPGSANAVVDNKQLAELLNWMVLQFAGNSLVGEFQPYTAEEVGVLRSEPLMEVNTLREALVKDIAAQRITTTGQDKPLITRD